MGAGHQRSAEARYKAPVALALRVALSHLDVLVMGGVEAYADALDEDRRTKIHDDLAKDILAAIAGTVRQAVRA